MSNSVFRLGLAVLIGFGVYAGVGLLLGGRPDTAGEWLSAGIKSLWVIALAAGTVEWLNRRKRSKAAQETSER
ncbi:hypothetical protein [Nocardia bovistercoris]|uniref:Uncharacterized protein n=1 Tax=Nocardia bovistercoris TaxID=2785916 RepID=A0A931IAE8_9NOCA|nr:hypothetical protein [Nocardia bovistercoris]MBH0776848.1 hypothetical protein [Nocardia bovistercoris]